MTPKPPPREQEQSIRARKEQLYEEDEAPKAEAAAKATKPFEVYLREVPATPLSATTKLILWSVGAVVVLLLIVTLLRTTGRQPTAPRKAEAPLRPAPIRLA
jgi:hypothetical protein